MLVTKKQNKSNEQVIKYLKNKSVSACKALPQFYDLIQVVDNDTGKSKLN